MAHDWFTLDELARNLGRDRRDLEKQVQRGRIPAHKRQGEWFFQSAEITQWLEQEMRGYSESQLAALEQAQNSSEVSATVPISTLLRPETIQIPLEARTKRSTLESLVEVAGRTWKIWEPATVLKAVLEREALHSTALENGVALPHPRQPLPDAVGEPVISFGRTSNAISWGATNNAPSDLFFLIVCRDTRTHLQVMARLSRMVQQPAFLERLRQADTAFAAHAAILDAEQQSPITRSEGDRRT